MKQKEEMHVHRLPVLQYCLTFESKATDCNFQSSEVPCQAFNYIKKGRTEIGQCLPEMKERQQYTSVCSDR